MISELGFVYFFVKAASRKTVKVWPVSHWKRLYGVACSYLESNLIRRGFGLLDTLDGAAEELLRMRLEMQHVVRGHRAQNALQAG
jgi:hypothetical protein